jgi:RNA polymerase sigma-70 factor (sigma-E family)
LPTIADKTAEISRLYREERRRLLRVAVLLAGDRSVAEDLVQEAFVALHRRWDSLADTSWAAGYLRVSVVNGARSLHRRRLVARRYLRGSEPEGAPSADAGVLLADEHESVVAAVRALPKRQQQVVVLRYWSQMSEAELAAALDISTGTVKSTASRALTAIERHLGSNQ